MAYSPLNPYPGLAQGLYAGGAKAAPTPPQQLSPGEGNRAQPEPVTAPRALQGFGQRLSAGHAQVSPAAAATAATVATAAPSTRVWGGAHFLLKMVLPPSDEQIHKAWSIHAAEYRSALKRKGVRTPATAWLDLQDVVLSERARCRRTGPV